MSGKLCLIWVEALALGELAMSSWECADSGLLHVTVVRHTKVTAVLLRTYYKLAGGRLELFTFMKDAGRYTNDLIGCVERFANWGGIWGVRERSVTQLTACLTPENGNTWWRPFIYDHGTVDSIKFVFRVFIVSSLHSLLSTFVVSSWYFRKHWAAVTRESNFACDCPFVVKLLNHERTIPLESFSRIDTSWTKVSCQ